MILVKIKNPKRQFVIDPNNMEESAKSLLRAPDTKGGHLSYRHETYTITSDMSNGNNRVLECTVGYNAEDASRWRGSW